MLGTLKLDKFRGFDAYELTDLTRVNLLVGRNNCGKTSILEAIHLLVSGNDLLVLARMANRQGDVSDTDAASGRGWEPDISHFFSGHRVAPGMGFRLSSGDGNGRYGQVSVMVEHAALEDPIQSPVSDDCLDQVLSLVLRIAPRVEGSRFDNLPVIPITEDGSLLIPRVVRFRRPWCEILPARPPVQFVAPDSLDLDHMRTMRDRVEVEGRESEVIEALQILDAGLESIHLLTSGSSRVRSGTAGVLLRFRGGGRRAPLGSYEDGMRRLLALSLSLIRTTNGFLLVDEIDTGLHWTVMEDMWRLVVDAGRQSSVQVFAMTHSYDCIRGLASLVDSRPEFAPDVSIQKIGSLDRAVSLDAEQILVAVDQDIEVR